MARAPVSRTSSAVEVNKFNAGLVTDASPLTAPDNSSLEEDNMVLNIDGSRQRRLGLDYEDGFQLVNTVIPNSPLSQIAINSYRWENAGGDPEKNLTVVQFGNEFKVFDLSVTPTSAGLIFTHLFVGVSTSQSLSFAVVDGLLIAVTGAKEVFTFTYKSPSTITFTTSSLLIRDFFGVEDIDAGVDITRGSAVQNRPLTLSQNHLYNLRNQSFGLQRINGNNENLADPIFAFTDQSAGVFPSNSDSVIEALYPDASDTDNRTVDRFFAKNLFSNPLGTTRAAQGYFIIDALERGSSRLSNDVENLARNPQLVSSLSNLPTDITPGGATTITEFAGRAWYGGFSGQVVDGDAKSPRMSSYILFSKIVDSAEDINLCYQEGDPTSKNNADVVDTDGGFIRINEAYGIKRLLNLGSSIMIIATNGVWRIVGGTDKGFTATNFTVEKITDRGCTAADSLAIVDGGFMFWGDDGIYHVHTDQFGGWVAENISFGRIQKLYDKINIEDKRFVKGAYDNYERKVRWLYYNRTIDTSFTKELVLDLTLKAYYVNTIKKVGTQNFPKAVGIYTGQPYSVTVDDVIVLADVDEVLVGSESVVVESTTKFGISQREIGYLVVTSESPIIQYTFAQYSNSGFRDWYSYDNVGADAEAFVVTSHLSGGDFQRDKQIPYITVHSRRTENGFQQIGDNLVPINESSCMLQARWDWSNTNSTGKWGREFQAYRYRKLYIPVDATDLYDNGFETVVTRNKLRGNGKVVSLKFRTEPYKNLHLYGWSMIFSVAGTI
jgi:hypothetical protein